MENLRFALIHLVVPSAGALLYLAIVVSMLKRQIKSPPIVSLFIIFATWGSLLILILTRFFWYWSGMATLGFAYLIFVAPFVMLIIAIASHLKRGLSRFHRAAFVASVSYIPIIAALMAGSSRWGIPFK